MMGLDNPIHLAFLVILVLLVFGAKRLPEMGRSLGSGLRGFRESISGEEPIALHPAEPAAVHADQLTRPVVGVASVHGSDAVNQRVAAQPVA